jgi:hypothetical protein
MYLGAALEVPALVVTVATKSTFKPTILQAHPDYTAAQLHSAEIARTLPLAIAAPIVVALWLWMAWANGRGLAWARIVSAVLFGIDTVNLALALAESDNTLGQVSGAVIWLVGLGAIVLLFSRESRPFYQSRGRP